VRSIYEILRVLPNKPAWKQIPDFVEDKN